MKVVKILVVLITCFYSFKLNAQVTYQLRAFGNSNGFVSYYEMHRIDFLNAISLEKVFSIERSRFDIVVNTFGLKDYITSFEFTQDKEQVYFVENFGDLYRYTIATGELEYLLDLTPDSSDVLINFYTETYDITFINDSTLYVSGKTHGWYNTNTNTFDLIWHPSDLWAEDFSPDKEIINDKMAAYKDWFIYNSFYKSNTHRRYNSLGNPGLNTELIDFNLFGLSNFSGPLVVIQYDCDSTVIYQGARHFSDMGKGNYYKVDINAGTVTYSHPYTEIQGGSYYIDKHYNQVQWKDCQRRIDLDRDDSSMGGVGFLRDSLCGFSQLPLCDQDIEISNEYPIDSVVIEAINPRMSQYLYFPAGDYVLRYPPNARQTIINSGSTQINDFEEAIRNAYLYVDNDPGITEIQIRFTVWYGGVAGKEAIATLRLASPVPQAGDDIQRAWCEGDPTLTLQSILAPNADPGGQFYNPDYVPVTSIPDYTAPASDTMYYVVTNGMCYDTARIINIIHPNPIITPPADTVLCDKEVLNVDFSTSDGNITWGDGSTDKVRQIGTSGSYAYTLSNVYGCSTGDTFDVTILPPAAIRPIDGSVCEGEIFSFMGQDYRTPGIYSERIVNSKGCDSILYQIDFRFYPDLPIAIEGNLAFCEGEKAVIEIKSHHTHLMLDGIATASPIVFDKSGIYRLSGTDTNGCYDETELEIISHLSPQVLTQDLLDTVYVPGIVLPVAYNGDIVHYLWSPAVGLDCDDCPYPQLVKAQDGTFYISVTDSHGCTAEASVMVSFKQSTVFLPTVIANRPAIPENGILYLKGNADIVYTMQVYDRWGNNLFDKTGLRINDPNEGWQPQDRYSPGVYVYKITYNEQDETKIIVGDITVL